MTAYASLKKEVSYEEVRAAYDKYYADETFIRVLDKDVCPQTKCVEGSNYVDVNFKIDPKDQTCHYDGCDRQPCKRCSRTGSTEYEPDVRFR